MSHWAARSIVDDYGMPPERVHVVGLGRNRDPAPPPARDWTVAAVPVRRLRLAAQERACGALRRSQRCAADLPAARLDVVGGHPRIDLDGVTGHGALRLEDPSETARLEDLYARATCFVLPSLHEPTGTVHAEAAAAGLPSIATTAGGVDTVIGDSGVLVDPADQAGLLEAMRRLADAETARAMGERARRRTALFTWPLVAERLVRALAPPGIDVSALAPFL